MGIPLVRRPVRRVVVRLARDARGELAFIGNVHDLSE
jgi:hypothetical protein